MACLVVTLAVVVLGGAASNSSAQAGGQAPAMFRGGGALTGVVDAPGVPELGAIAWTFDTGAPVRSSPVLFDGVVYVGSSDHHLYAIDEATGNERWRFAADASIPSAPAVDDTRVVITSRPGTVFAVSRGTGEQLWRVDVGDEAPLPWGPEGWDYTTASPVLTGDLVLSGAGDGLLRAIDADTGEVTWSFDAGARIRSTPAVVDGRVLFGASDGMFYALDLSDGSELWRFETAGHSLNAADVGFDRQQIYSSAAVADGVAYFGSRDAFVYALDATTGAELWRSGDGTSAWVISSPAVAGNRVYSARSSSTNVRALDAANGEEAWSFAAGSIVFSSPVVAGDTLYVGLASGTLLAADTATGEMRWRYRTGGAIWGTPEVSGDRVYVGSDDGRVYAFEAASGPAPRLAVYSQDDLPFTRQISTDAQGRIRSYFEARAYEVLDDASIAGFMSARIEDGAPSVVMFAVDHLPDVAIGAEATPLYRRYLEAGGKIVWMGAPPEFFVFDAEAGQVVGVDLERPAELLSVDMSDFRTDIYPVVPTDVGNRWGLASGWIGNGGFAESDITEVLARDELGRVVAFARNHGGPEGSGWVYVPLTVDAGKLDEIRAVAEYGVMRTPPPGHE